MTWNEKNHKIYYSDIVTQVTRVTTAFHCIVKLVPKINKITRVNGIFLFVLNNIFDSLIYTEGKSPLSLSENAERFSPLFTVNSKLFNWRIQLETRGKWGIKPTCKDARKCSTWYKSQVSNISLVFHQTLFY